MTDRELQDLLDRLAHEGGEPADMPAPEAEDTADWKAYRLLYTVLDDEPDGALPPNFAEQVADRVLPAEAPATAMERFPWLEWVLPPLLLVAAFVATLLLMPTVLQTGTAAMQLVLDPLSSLWTQLRLDIALTAGATVLIIGLIDRLVLRAWFRGELAAT